ncbi:DUF2339 domain-containing protein [Nocardia sp. NBC_01503]|uniref:DUF2339 domain-containing protein n=1 Tax=Nocardia sp. NBC_01503 TaxID=2975997 RepID=UPI002E7C101A|nr:DUF2339 domain-containing protein [Nocardia sp. NBC_01503]WTL34935.1 DUF2339 domain-containing protein [Nocardia sp. NBC_01503]
MNTAIDPRLIARLSTEFTSLSEHMGILGRDLEVLRTQLIVDPLVARPAAPFAPPAAAPAAGVPMFGPGQAPRPGPDLSGSAEGEADSAAEPIPSPSAPGASGGGEALPQPGVVPGSSQAVPGGFQAVSGYAQAGPGYAQLAPGYGQTVPGCGQTVPGYAQGGPTGYAQAGVGRAGWMGSSQGGYRTMPPLPRQQRRGVPVRERRAPWWQREGVVSRVLAVAGVTVTLIGVVMLLVLAAQAGFFGPVPRVVAGAVFSGVLVAFGVRVHGKAGGQVGAVALAATGIAGGYLDVVAVTTNYGWLNPVVGYAIALGVAAGGVGLAMQWRSQALAVLVVVGAALLAPVITLEVALLVFLIVLQIAAVPVQLGRDWPYLHIVRTIPAVLATLVAVAAAGLGDASRWHRYEVLAAAVAIAVVGLAGTVLVVRRRSTDITASLTCAAATMPLLAAPAMFERPTAVLISAAFAVVLLTLAALRWVPKLAERVRIPGHLAVVAAVAGAFAVLETCFGVTDTHTLPVALFLVAVAFLGAGGQQRSRVAAGIGAAFGALGMVAFLDIAGPATLSDQWYAQERLGISTALSAAAALAALAAAFRCARRLGLVARESDATAVAVVGGMAGLYAVTALTVSLGVATGRQDGFLAGHGIATVVWMAAATAALFFGLRRLSRAPQSAKVALAGGLLVTAAALAKLFLFDLATLDGLLRAAAFLVVGVLLLLVGTRYARAFAEAGESARRG